VIVFKDVNKLYLKKNNSRIWVKNHWSNLTYRLNLPKANILTNWSVIKLILKDAMPPSIVILSQFPFLYVCNHAPYSFMPIWRSTIGWFLGKTLSARVIFTSGQRYKNRDEFNQFRRGMSLSKSLANNLRWVVFWAHYCSLEWVS